MPSSLASC